MVTQAAKAALALRRKRDEKKKQRPSPSEETLLEEALRLNPNERPLRLGDPGFRPSSPESKPSSVPSGTKDSTPTVAPPDNGGRRQRLLDRIEQAGGLLTEPLISSKPKPSPPSAEPGAPLPTGRSSVTRRKSTREDTPTGVRFTEEVTHIDFRTNPFASAQDIVTQEVSSRANSLATVFPEFDLGRIDPDDPETAVGRMQEFLQTALDSDPQRVADTIREIGWTPDTEVILASYNVIGDTALEEFFQQRAQDVLDESLAVVFPDLTPEEAGVFLADDPEAFMRELQTGFGDTQAKRAILDRVGATFEEREDILRRRHVVLPLDGVNQLITVDMGTFTAFDQDGRRVGSYHPITMEFTSLPDEGKAKDILDAAVFGAAGAWNRSKGFFLSTVPNLIFRDMTGVERTLFGDDWADAADAHNQALRDQFREAYARNQQSFELWQDKNPDLLPNRIQYEQGALQHPGLLRDPAYWAYELASVAPYMAASMIAAVAGTVLSGGNPVIGLIAASAVLLPSETEAVRVELLANGMPEEQADRVALAAGAVIASLEGLGRIPFFKAIAPHIMRRFRQETGKEVARLTVSALAKKGIRTATTIEIAEVLTEVMQEAVQNVAVGMADPERGLLDNLDNIAVKTAVATALPSLLGGGASMVRVPPSRVGGQVSEATLARISSLGAAKQLRQVSNAALAAQESEITRGLGRIPAVRRRRTFLAGVTGPVGEAGQTRVKQAELAAIQQVVRDVAQGQEIQVRLGDTLTPELRAAIEEAAQALQPTVQGQVTDPETGNVYEVVDDPALTPDVPTQAELDTALPTLGVTIEIQQPPTLSIPDQAVTTALEIKQEAEAVIGTRTAESVALTQQDADALRRESNDLRSIRNQVQERGVESLNNAQRELLDDYNVDLSSSSLVDDISSASELANTRSVDRQQRVDEFEQASKELGAAEAVLAQRSVPEAVVEQQEAQIVADATAGRIKSAKPEQLPTLTSQVRDAHREVLIDIENVRERGLMRRGKRTPENRMLDLILKGAVGQLGVAEGLVTKIEANQDLTAKEIAGLNQRIASMKDQSALMREKVATEAEQKAVLVKVINSTLPLSQRGKLLTAVKNVKTEKGLQQAIARVDAVLEQHAQRTLRAQIRSELKAAKTTKVRGIVKGKFTPETQRQLDAISAVVDENREDARETIANNVEMANTGQMDFADMAEANELLTTSAGIDGMSSSELTIALENIKAIKATGKSVRKEKLDATKAQRDENRAMAIDVITGGKGLNEVNVSLTPEEVVEANNIINRVYNGNIALDNKTDWLSKFDPSEPHESRLSVFGRRVHGARNTEHIELETENAKVLSGLQEVHEVENLSELNRAVDTKHDTVVLGPFTNRDGQQTTLTMKRGELIKIYMELQDPTLDATYTEGMAWTTEMKDAAVNALTSQERAWGDWHLQYYRDSWQAINDVYSELYFTDLSFNPFHSPVRRHGVLTKDAQGKDVGEIILVLQDSARHASTLNGSLKARVKNIKPLRRQDADAVLINHIVQMAHFKAWAGVIRDLRGVFGSQEVRSAMRQYHSGEMVASIDNDINLMAQNGRNQAGIVHWMDVMRSRFAVASLGIKPRIMLGQFTSTPAFATQMPIRDFPEGIIDFWKHPLANAKFLEENSAFYRARFALGPERDVRLAQEATPMRRMLGVRNWPRIFLSNVTFGDRVAVTPGMWAVFKSRLKKMGVTKEEATQEQIDEAMQGAEQATRMSQDTAEIETLSSWQNGPSWVRLMTMYQTQPNKYFRIVADNARNIRYGRGRKDKAVFNILMAWVIMPAIFQFLVDGGEFKLGRQLRSWALGPYNNILVFGQIAQSLQSWISDEPQDLQISPLFQTVEDLFRGVRGVVKIMGDIDNPYTKMDPDDLVSAIESFGRAGGSLTGIPTHYLVQVSKAIRDGEPKELVFTRWGLHTPGKSERDKAKELTDNLGEELRKIAEEVDDPAQRREAREAAAERAERRAKGETLVPEPILDMERLRSRFKLVLGDTLPDDIIEDRKFTPLARSWAEFEKALAEKGRLPDRPLYKIGTGKDDVDTIEQYRKQWRAREGIDNLADLRDNERAAGNAHLGNVTAAQYTLIRDYERSKDRPAFLEAHPALRVNPALDWRKAHPKEDALLTFWGDVGILTRESYDALVGLIADLDVAEELLPEFSLPPPNSVETHFAYRDHVDQDTETSWEAQLLLAEDEAKNGTKDSYRAWKGLKKNDRPIASLKLLVADRDLYDEEQDLKDTLPSTPDRDDPGFLEGKEGSLERLREAFPEWVDNQRRIEVLDTGADADIAEGWVERGRLVDEFGSNSAEAQLWLVDHRDVWQWAFGEGIITSDGTDWNVPVLRLNVEFRDEDTTYEETIPERFANIQDKDVRDEKVRAARAKYLEEQPEYRKGRRRREGFQLGLSGGAVEQHIRFYELSSVGFRRDRWLLENPDYYREVWLNPDKLGNSAIDFKAIPNPAYDDILDRWGSEIEVYYNLIPDRYSNLVGLTRANRIRQARNRLFARRPGFFRDRIRFEAHGRLVPSRLINGYVSYYSTLYRGKPRGWDRWWADDRVLRDNPTFFSYMRRNSGWQDRDLTNLPSVAFERTYNETYIRIRHPDGSADRGARAQFRRANPGFDAEGVKAGLWVPITSAKDNGRKETTRPRRRGVSVSEALR